MSNLLVLVTSATVLFLSELLSKSTMRVSGVAFHPFSGDFYELNKSCHKTWSLFEASFNLSKISRGDFIQGSRMEMCDSPDAICCNEMLEKTLSQLALKQYKKAFVDKYLLPLKTNLINYAYNFDNLIKEILDMSRMEFDHEFNKTFMSESSVRHLAKFDQFFVELNSYFSEYQASLKDIIRKLFANIARMTIDTTSSTTGTSHDHKPSRSNNDDDNDDDDDDECFDEFVLDSDTRMDLERKLECALESVRLFSASLTKLRDIIIEFYVRLDQMTTWSSCLADFTQIYSCSMCLGDQPQQQQQQQHSILVDKKLTFVKPCYHACLSVYKSCISLDFNKFDSAWNLYINLIKNFSQSIEFKMNFESTMSTLKYELLDIIFNYQVNSDLIVSKHKTKCLSSSSTTSATLNNSSRLRFGKVATADADDRHQHKRYRYELDFGHRRRRRNLMSQVEEQMKSAKTRRVQRSSSSSSSNESLKIKLHLFFIDLNSYLFNMTFFWSQLLPNACKPSEHSSDMCWNGSKIISKNSFKPLKFGTIGEQKSKWTNNNNETHHVLNMTFWTSIQHLKLYNVKINRQIDKINANEKLFSKTPNFRVLVDSISFYNAKHEKAKNILKQQQQQQQKDEDYLNQENVEYYDDEDGNNADKLKRTQITKLRKFVPKYMRSGGEQQESTAAALATEEYDYDDNSVGGNGGDEDVPTNYMYPDQLDYNQYEDEMERSFYDDEDDDYWQKETASSRTTSDDEINKNEASDSFYKDKKPVFENPKRIKQNNNNKSSSSSSSSFSSIIRQKYDKFTQLFSNRSNASRVGASVSIIQMAIGVFLLVIFFAFE